MNPHTGTVRLIDRRLRLVELFGSAPLGSRGPTDQELLFDHRQAGLCEYVAGPQPVGFCFQADGRRAKFLVNERQWGYALLDLLAFAAGDSGAAGAAVRALGLAGGGMSGGRDDMTAASGPAPSSPLASIWLARGCNVARDGRLAV